jgi:hypothetical protein
LKSDSGATDESKGHNNKKFLFNGQEESPDIHIKERIKISKQIID